MNVGAMSSIGPGSEQTYHDLNAGLPIPETDPMRLLRRLLPNCSCLALLALAAIRPGLHPLPAAAVALDEKLEIGHGDHISIIGNTLADRMQHDGWLETYLHSRFPKHDLVFRNLGFSGDELTIAAALGQLRHAPTSG